MMQPMNYTINTPDVSGSFMQGAQNAAGFANAQAQAEAARQKVAAQQAAAERQAYQQKRFQEAAQNPTSGNVQKLMIEFPELSEQFDRSLKALTTGEKENVMGIKYMIRSALKQGKPEIAVQELDRMIEAARNSGDAAMLQALEVEKDGLIASPNGARLAAESFLFASMGKDYAEMAAKEGEEERAEELRPANLKKATADADKAATIARFAESQEAIDLQKKGWDIKKLQNDIQVSRQNVAIAAQNAAVNRANSATAKQEAQIKLQDLLDKRATTVREKTAEVENARSTIDNFLNTTDRITNTPMSVVGSAAGPISSRIPTMSQSTADFEALIENIDAQAFMAQIPNMKGMGALSNAEGAKVTAALQNFSLKQSPEQLIKNVKEAQRIMLKARKALAEKFGVPETVPDTPAAAGNPGEIEALLEKYR